MFDKRTYEPTRKLGPDCDDDDNEAHPGATEEACSTRDLDCDGFGSPLGADAKPADYGAASWNTRACRSADLSCPSGHPFAETPGDAHDEDCDGIALDRDGDGFALDAHAEAITAAGGSLPEGVTGGDCDDDNAGAHPGATEVEGNRFDEDCDGVAPDADGDSYWSAAQIRSVDTSTEAGKTRQAELLAKGIDCDDTNAAANPGATVSPVNKAESLLAGYFETVEGAHHRKAAFCDLFDADSGLLVESAWRRLVDVNCDGLFTDIDGDGWTVPGDHTYGEDRAHDCNDLDPRVFPQGEPETARLADCTIRSDGEAKDHSACLPKEPRFMHAVGAEVSPLCPSSPSGLSTACSPVPHPDRSEPSPDWVCGYEGDRPSDPPLPPASAGQLWGACAAAGHILPPCTTGYCVGPANVSDAYIAALNKLFEAERNCTPDEQGDGVTCDTVRLVAADWIGICVPRCDSCAAKTCTTENPCAWPTCDGATGECGENPSGNDGASCEDGNSCTTVEMCYGGECIAQRFVDAGAACALPEGGSGMCGKRGEDYLCLETSP